MAAILGTAQAATESFEGGTVPPAGWTVRNVSGANTWVLTIVGPKSGDACARISYSYPAVGEDWLISPQISNLAASETVTFWIRKASSNDYETSNLEIRVSTTDTDPGSFTEELATIDINALPSTDWLQYSYSLAGFEGQNIYVAFKYYNLDGQDLFLDEVTLPDSNATPTLTSVSTLSGATEDTAYTITYADLAAAADEADGENDAISFRIEAVSSGTLTKNSAAVTPGVTLLATGEELLWTPAANANGTLDAFTVKAWDGTSASSTAVQVQVAVEAVNDAPSASGLPASFELTEDTPYNPDFSAASFSDPDSASITVTLAASNGTFAYAADGNSPAAALSGILTSQMTITGAPSTVNLYLSTPTNITYTPAANLASSPAGTLTVTANDGDGSGNVELGTIAININAVNDAPSFTEGATLAAVLEDTANPAGETLFALLNSKFSDLEGELAGIAVTANVANSGTEGTWQYSSDGGDNWFDVGTVSASAALLLDASTKVRFLPAANFSGTPSALTVYAVDNSSATTFTSGSTRRTFDTTSDDATSKVAASGVSLGTSITGGNDAPTLTATAATPIFVQGGSSVPLFSAAAASTIEAGQAFSSLTLTVTNVSDEEDEIMGIDGSSVQLTDGYTVGVTGSNSLVASVTVVGTTATVTIADPSPSLTPAQLEELINDMIYLNTSETPTADPRVVTITQVVDNGGTDNGGVDTTPLAIASTVTIDLAPTVTGRTVPTDGTYKTGDQLDFTVTYSENVTVNTGGGTPYISVTLDTGGSVQADYNAAASTADTLTFRYTVVSGDLDLEDGIAVASFITLNGATLKGSADANAPTTGLGFGTTAGILVDGKPPTVSSINRQTPSSSRTNETSVVYRVTFAEPVTGVDATDFTLVKTGADGLVDSVEQVSSTVYDVTVTSVSGNGTLGLNLNASGTGIVDAPGNAIDGGYNAGETYTIDHTPPSISSIVRQSPTTVNTNATSITYRVTFDAGVTGVDAADFTLVAPTGNTPASTATGTVAAITPVNTSVYDVVVSTVSGQGKARLDLKSTGTGIADLAGNAIDDGGFTAGEFYFVGATSVFDSLSMTYGAAAYATATGADKVAQRFTTAAGGPLTLSSVVVKLNAITGTPVPAVKVFKSDTDDASIIGTAPEDEVGTLTNPSVLTEHALNVWTGSVTLQPSTTYWIVFANMSDTISQYGIDISALTTGGSDEWLTATDYQFRWGANAGTALYGALRISLGATSIPTITSPLTASGTYKTAFTYNTSASNSPTSYAATGLPAGLSIDAETGVISGTPTQTGTFDIDLTATNDSGTGPASTLALTIGKAALTAKADAKSRAYGSGNPALTVSYTGLLGGDTAASLTTEPSATTTANASSPVGTYPITVSGGVSDNYTFTYEPGVLTITNADQTITFAGPDDLIIGASTTLTATASSGLPVSFSVISGPATLSGSTLTTTGVGIVKVRASQAGDADYSAAPNVDRSFSVTVGPATITTPEQVPVPPLGGTAQLVVSNSNPNVDYTWQRNGSNLLGGTGPSLTLTDVQPPTAGLYTYTATVPGGGSGTSEPVIVGLTTDDKVVGTGDLVGSDIQHPNGNVYDQALLEGPGAAITADQGKITRISFVDLSNDIVQVEFSGAGTVSVIMDDASSPSPAINYNQQDVDYVRGHVGLVITGANETSNLSVFSVGPVTAVNQSLFKPDVTYDGVADLAFVAIQSTNGKFGGVRTGNVHYFANQGFTGVYAPGVEFTGPVNIGDVTAFDAATPVLVFGSVALVQITGGNLAQDNGLPVTVGGIVAMKFVPGTTSQGDTLPAQANAGVLTEDGVDVTDDIVVAP